MATDSDQPSRSSGGGRCAAGVRSRLGEEEGGVFEMHLIDAASTKAGSGEEVNAPRHADDVFDV